MAKISPVSIKYMIYAAFRAEGHLEKPDVIGAIFGQTEGLLGSNLEMRELQKEGKIGRIEVELETVDGKSVGEIQVPTALDKSETTIIAAALETIDRIGPTEASIQINKIEDVRGSKRDFIIERAKKLLEGLDDSGDFEGMSKTLKEESRAAKIQEYGEEKLPAGDLTGKEVIVVEGRADVVNLLKNRVNNVIGMNGTKLPAEIARLGQDKEITLFVDGDRGGKLIAQNVINNARIMYVAVAPDGKEVEELVGKEILVALRKRMTTSEFMRSALRGDFSTPSYSSTSPSTITPSTSITTPSTNSISPSDVKEKSKQAYEKIKDSRQALLVDETFDVIKKVSAKEVGKNIKLSRKKIFAIIMDGAATSSIVRSCEEEGVLHLAATTFSGIDTTSVNLISL